jgi:hypothetical protein
MIFHVQINARKSVHIRSFLRVSLHSILLTLQHVKRSVLSTQRDGVQIGPSLTTLSICMTCILFDMPVIQTSGHAVSSGTEPQDGGPGFDSVDPDGHAV